MAFVCACERANPTTWRCAGNLRDPQPQRKGFVAFCPSSKVNIALVTSLLPNQKRLPLGAAIKAPFDCTATPTPARSVWLSVAKTSLGRAHATPPSAKMARSRQLNFSLIEHDKYPQLKFLIMEQPTPASTPEVLQVSSAINVRQI